VIVVDASAILAILLKEPDAEVFREILLRRGGGVISPVNHWEVLTRARSARGETGRRAAEILMAGLGVEVGEISGRHSRLAADAAERFGRATPARLNLGDCFAYALAATEGDGLLFKGDDLSRTDVKAALP
jgi:ribonuclease VapC